MSVFFNMNFLRNILFYVIISFVLSFLITTMSLKEIKNSTELTMKEIHNVIEEKNIKNVLFINDTFFITKKEEKGFFKITEVNNNNELISILKKEKIDIKENMSNTDIILMSLKIFFILLFASFIFILNKIESRFKLLKKEQKDTKEVKFLNHFFNNYSLYKDIIKEHIDKISNPSITPFFFLFFAIATFSSIADKNSGLKQSVIEQSNSYIYSDFIKDVENKDIEFVDIKIKDNVYFIKVKNKDNEESEFKTGNAEELKLLLNKNNIKYNEENKGQSFNSTPYIITFFIISFFCLIIIIGSKATKKEREKLIGKKDNFEILAKKPNVTLKDVKGIDEIKEDVQEIIDMINNKQMTNELGGKIPKGILLNGQPGVGKTLLSKAIAGETDYNFIFTNGSEFAGKYQGQGVESIVQLFIKARENQPCIIFIDELDGVGKKRGMSQNSGDTDRTLNRLLVELDGFNTKEDNIMIIGATNFPDQLDPALIRAGRFDRDLTIPLPRFEGRLEILKYFVSKIKAEDNIDLDYIAHHTSNYSGASLENLINESALLAAREKSEYVTIKHIEESQNKLMMGNKLPIKMSERERWLTAYHEAGHAIVTKKSKGNDLKVHKVSIIPRGKALGVTIYVPEEEKYSMSKVEVETRIASLYGGRLAEELVVGAEEVTTGASNDFERATQEAERMVKSFGLNNKSLLTLSYKDRENKGSLSESDKSTMEDILINNYKKAATILEENKLLLRNFAKALMFFDSIDEKQINEIMKGEDITITEKNKEGLLVPVEFDIMEKNFKIKEISK